jgi:hypothetical protein
MEAACGRDGDVRLDVEELIPHLICRKEIEEPQDSPGQFGVRCTAVSENDAGMGTLFHNGGAMKRLEIQAVMCQDHPPMPGRKC